MLVADIDTSSRHQATCTIFSIFELIFFFNPHQLLREINVSVAAQCATMFASYALCSYLLFAVGQVAVGALLELCPLEMIKTRAAELNRKQ